MTLKFNTCFSVAELKASNPGNDEVEQYDWQYNEDRKRFIPIVTGHYSQKAFINASASSCDINTIFERALNGDMSVLNVKNPYYMDTTVFPKNVNELNSLANKSKEGFENLPSDIKLLWNDDYNLFFNSVLDGSVSSTIENYVSQKVNVDLKKESDTNE